MPILFGKPYPLTYAGYPPHMSREDYTIWLNTKDRLTEGAERLFFDVGLGGAKEIPEDYEPSFRYMWNRLNQKRIDVLAEYKDYWKIIELRVRATSTAIGRLLQYKTLWEEDPPDGRKTILVLATDIPDPDLLILAPQVNIEIVTILK